MNDAVTSLSLSDGGGGSVTGRLHEVRAAGAPVVVLTHGAGGNLDTPGLVRVAESLAGCGVRVLRFNLPAAEAGKKRPDRPSVAMRAISAVVESVCAKFDAPCFVGGRSFGGRTASMVLADASWAVPEGVAGAVLLAYPLKPPGKPAVPPERVEYLGRIGVPTLFVSGDRDPFAPPELMNPVVESVGAEMRWIAGADHGFRRSRAWLRSQQEAEPSEVKGDSADEIAAAVAAFIARR